jgi:hypothetical protein
MVLCETPVALLVTVILALATTAPDGSVTVPVIFPVTSWANRAEQDRVTNASATATVISLCILVSLNGVRVARVW